MSKRFLKIIICILLVLSMTLANFLLIFANVVTYAADVQSSEVSTNNKNVEFSAVLQRSGGEEGSELDVKTDESDLKLHMKVTVKQEGYLNGTIEIDNANFEIKKDILSEGITKIEGNTITLSQINAGETRDLVVGIEAKREEAFDLSLLNMESKISLNGTYRDSSEKDIEIKGTRTVKLELVSPYTEENIGNILKQEMITNKVITKDGESKRVIQMEVESGLEGNLYPIETDKIEIETPKIENKNPERVEVEMMEESVINGKKIEEGEWEYREEEGKVVVEIKNEAEENKVTWKREGSNKIIITYVYDTEAEIERQEIELKSEIKLYDRNKTVITGGYRQEIIEEDKDNIVRVEVRNSEDNIYKGKIQEGIEREITEEVGIEVTAEGIAEKIEIEEDNSEINLRNVYARRTIMRKEEVDEILGEAGRIIIYNADTGEVISTIDKNTEIDENGKILTIEEAEEIARAIASDEEVKRNNNIVIEYPDNVSRIGIQIVNAEKSGKIELSNTKVIKDNIKEEVEQISNINYIINGRYYIGEQENSIESKKATINLLNTVTTAKLEINKTELSTMTENTGVEIRAVLQSNNEKYDLYENPRIRIELPEKIEKIEVNSINLLYAENEMTIVDPILNGNAIEMTLEGEQKEYKDGAIEGVTVIINADLTLDKKLGNSTEKIRLGYTNENAVTYEGGAQQGTEEVDIGIKSYAGVITTTEIPEYGVSVINNEGTKEGRLEIRGESKEAVVDGGIINNTGGKVTDVKLIGIYPTKDAIEGNNIDISVSNLTIEGPDLSKVTVYYTENANATDDINDVNNGWKEEFNDNLNVKKYLILINDLDIQEEFKFKYTIVIPENLEYNYLAKQGYMVSYVDANLVKQQVNLDLITLQTGSGPVVETQLKAFSGPLEATSYVMGESYLKYQITATNTGSEEARNVILTGLVPDGSVYVEDLGTSSGVGDISHEGGFVEYPDKKTVEFNIESLQPGESVVKEYMVKVHNGYTSIANEINVKYGELTNKSNSLVLNVKDGKITMKIFSVDINDTLIAGYGYSYVVVLDNITDETLTDVYLNINVGELEFVKVRAYEESNLILESFDNEISIDQIEPNQTISLIVNVEVPILDISTKPHGAYVYAEVGEDTYYTNVKEANIRTYMLEIENKSPNSGEYVKVGDSITYNIKITNTEDVTVSNINMKDRLSQYVVLDKVKKNGVELSKNDYYISYDYTNNLKILNVDSDDSLEPGESIDYEVTAIVDDVQVDEPVELINIAGVYNASIEIDTSEVIHILEPTPIDPDDPNNPTDPDDPNNPDDPNDPGQETRIISGIAWLDSNENGQKDEGETMLSGIMVRILNAQTNEFLKDSNGNDITSRTNSNGFYSLSNIPQGEYIVIFEYDTNKYMLTDYNKEGADSRYTSKVIRQELTIDGETKTFGGTEIINVSDSSIANINIGLREIKEYDLKLEKFVSRIITQNGKGTTIKDFGDSTLAKAEIDAKLINNTNVVVEYKIRITNEGEVPAYVRRVVDYVSSEYTFSSELNSDWYEQDGRLYNASLSNERIEPGESKELTLTLTKKMTENNTGLISNTAEIAESYNEQGIKDKDSTENNNATGEDDLGRADVILSIKTGQVISTIGIILASIAIIGFGAFIVIRILNKRGKI